MLKTMLKAPFRTRKAAVVAGAALVALVGVGGGVAFAASGSSSPSSASTTLTAASSSATSAPSTATKARRHRSLLDRAEHAVATVRTKTGTEVIDLQRGQVSSVSPTSVTVRSADGFTTSYVVASTSKVHKDGKTSTIGNIAAGDRVVVVATHSGDTDTVKDLGDHGPAPAGH